jgi:hypothetical protein
VAKRMKEWPVKMMGRARKMKALASGMPSG